MELSGYFLDIDWTKWVHIQEGRNQNCHVNSLY